MTRMKKAIYLSLVCSLSLQAAQVELGTIDVEAKIDTEVIKDVHGEDIKSADLAEALFKQSPSISMVRRSGIANDVIVRGQKKDNVNVTMDGVKVFGAWGVLEISCRSDKILSRTDNERRIRV